jgi:hypothetical protein
VSDGTSYPAPGEPEAISLSRRADEGNEGPREPVLPVETEPAARSAGLNSVSFEEDALPHASMPMIWELIEKVGAEVPDSEWAKVPEDLAKNLDHYLYGAPKHEE